MNFNSNAIRRTTASQLKREKMLFSCIANYEYAIVNSMNEFSTDVLIFLSTLRASRAHIRVRCEFYGRIAHAPLNRICTRFDAHTNVLQRSRLSSINSHIDCEHVTIDRQVGNYCASRNVAGHGRTIIRYRTTSFGGIVFVSTLTMRRQSRYPDWNSAIFRQFTIFSRYSIEFASYVRDWEYILWAFSNHLGYNVVSLLTE